MNLLVGVSAPDDKTFVIELSEPYYPLLTELGVTRPFAMISPKAMKDGSTKDGVNAYIGTGPYVLTDFVTDEYAVFEANENYWGEQPKIKKITVKVIPDNQTRILALEKGEIDMIFGKNMIDADAINQYTGNDKFTVSLSDPTSTRQIVLNTTKEVLADKEVRQALQHATNKQAISDGIFMDWNSRPIHCSQRRFRTVISILNRMHMMWSRRRACWMKLAGLSAQIRSARKTVRN